MGNTPSIKITVADVGTYDWLDRWLGERKTRALMYDTWLRRSEGGTVYQGPGALVVTQDGEDIMVFRTDGTIRLDTHWDRSEKRKRRINGYLPKGVEIRVENKRWVLHTRSGGTLVWHDGIVLVAATGEVQKPTI